jgi:hypothetical protein
MPTPIRGSSNKPRRAAKAAPAAAIAPPPPSRSIVSIAERTRHLSILNKIQRGALLTTSEMRELRRYEGIATPVPARQIPAVGGAYDDRKSHAQIMRVRRAAARVVEIPEPKDFNRRQRCLADPEMFPRVYWPKIFYNPFDQNQKVIIHEIVSRVGTGGNLAEAVPRGGGKTCLTLCVGGIWAPAAGKISYLVILTPNGKMSEDELADLKMMYECSDDFADDFPEICTPIRALEGSPQRARTQTARTAGGTHPPERTWLVWATDNIVLPTVRLADGQLAKTSGFVVKTKGIDGAVRGLVRGGKRPDLVIGDDLETQESAYSKKQVEDRKRYLKRDVMGLSGPNDPMPILVLGTIITSGCLMDQLTDRQLNPGWGGVRLKRVLAWPKRMDLWEKYFEQCRVDQREGDKAHRTAHQFYLTNQTEMDEGAEVSTPYRLKNVTLPDGSILEVTALQSAMNDLYDMEQEGFDAEHQGQPHKDEREEGAALDPVQVMRKLNGIPKGFIPIGTEAVTIGIDIHARLLYWVAVAWTRELVGNIFDYGDCPIHSPLTGNLKDEENVKLVKDAIFNALVEFREWEQDNGWQVQGSSEVKHADLINIDTGYMDTAVFKFLQSGKGSGCFAVAGYGSTGQRSYPKPPPAGKIRRLGTHWWASIKDGWRTWLHHVDSDHWKLHVQTGFMIKSGTNGSISLFGDQPVIHSAFAKQICAERWKEEFVPGKGIRKSFCLEHRNNHWLDCLHYATVGAEMMGLGAPPVNRPPKQPVQDSPAPSGPGSIRTSY